MNVTPAGEVMVMDLAAQSMIAWCLVNQSIPKMISMSVDLRAIKEVGNEKYPISMTAPWVTQMVFQRDPGVEISRGVGISSNGMSCNRANF